MKYFSYSRDTDRSKPLIVSLTLWTIGAVSVRAVEPMSTVILLAAGTLTRSYAFGNTLLSAYTISGAFMAIILARVYDKISQKNIYIFTVSIFAVILHILLAIALILHTISVIIYSIAILSAAIPSALPGIARVILSSLGKNSTILALDAINVELAWICGPIIAAWASKTSNIAILLVTMAIAYLLAAITLVKPVKPVQKTHISSSNMHKNPFRSLETVHSKMIGIKWIFSHKILISLVDSFSIGLIEIAVIVSLPLILWKQPHAISVTGILVSFLSITGIIGGIVYWRCHSIIPFSINTQTFISLLLIALLSLATLEFDKLFYMSTILGIMGFFITQLNIQRAISLDRSIDKQYYAQGSTAQYACFASGAALASWGMSYLHNYHYLLISAISIGLICSLFIRIPGMFSCEP